MTNQEKAVMYEAIVSEGDRLNREKSKLKAENAGINMSKETEMSIADLDKRLFILETRLNELVR